MLPKQRKHVVIKVLAPALPALKGAKIYLAPFRAGEGPAGKRVFGRDIGILNEVTKEGNKSIMELRRIK